MVYPDFCSINLIYEVTTNITGGKKIMKTKIASFGIILGLVALSISVPSVFAVQKDDASIKSHLDIGDEYVVPDCIIPGDILLMDMDYGEDSKWTVPGPYNEHAALYIGNNEFIHAGGDNNRTVAQKSYGRFYIPAKNIAFVRVKTANNSTREAVINWASDRIGAPYQVVFEPPWFFRKIANPFLPLPSANMWYCMELPWAAYYNQGIDIDKNEWRIMGVSGNDILFDDDIEIIYRELNNNTEIIKPRKGLYSSNRMISPLIKKTFVLGAVDVEVNATADAGVNRVEFYVDGEHKASVTSEPYVWKWDEKSLGKHALKVTAVDNADNNRSFEIEVWKFF